MSRGWFHEQYEAVEPIDFDPTDAEQGGLPAAWAESRRYNLERANTDTEEAP